MKKRLLMALAVVLVCAACSGGSSSSGVAAGSSGDSSDESASLTALSSTTDLVEELSFSHTLTLDFTAQTARLDAEAASDYSGGLSLSGADLAITITPGSYGLAVTSTGSAMVKYVLSGSLAGSLTLDSAATCQLYLDELAISATAGPALVLANTAKAFIVTTSSSGANTFTDAAKAARNTSGLTQKAVIYSAGPLVFSGDGELDVIDNYKHGIYCDDYVRVRGGTIDISTNPAISTVRDGIHTVNGFVCDDGELTIDVTGTSQGDESKGIKVEGLDDASGAGKGYIVISGGTLTIDSVSKAITAGWDIDEDTTSYTDGNPNPFVVIDDGVISITTTGTPDDDDSDGYTLSPEGIEAKADLTVNGGELHIETTDDALNACDDMLLKGGYIYCKSSGNDAIDANGDLTIAGGVIVAIGTGAPEGSFDYDDDDPATANAFTITGGTFVGIGGTTARPTSCSQSVVVLGSYASGKTVALRSGSGSGAVVFAYKIPQSYATMILSTPAITPGTRYYVCTAGTATAASCFNNLYLGTLSYSSTSSSTSFTAATSFINQLGGSFF